MDSYKTITANLDAKDLKFGVVISRWHDFVNEKLLAGAVDTIERHGGSATNIEVVYVPGSFEIPFTTKKLAASKKYDAVIAIGTVIRGQTLHFDLIAAEAVKGISQVSLETDVPVALGILTTDTIEQSLERAGSKHGNKGAEAAIAAIEMANLVNKL